MSGYETPDLPPSAYNTLLELFERQTAEHSLRQAYTFCWEDGSEKALTYAQLAQQAKAIAAALAEAARPGDRALLVYPAGLDFIAAFFGCVAAGVLAVPATYPRPRRPMPRLTAIAKDCGATVALTTSQTLATLDLERMAPDLQSLRWIATDAVPEEKAQAWQPPQIGPEDLVFLQYTSGSTSDPKGVMVSNRNLLANLEMIRRGFGIEPTTGPAGPGVGVFWLPAYHDMGLIGGILEAFYTGGHSVLMAPAAFVQRPLRWLQAISDYGAIISGGPNSAYELCVRRIPPEKRAGLDLSRWRVAFCGAEPIRAQTLDLFAEAFGPCGFRPEAFYPCYGLAEATLLAAGNASPSPPAVLNVRRNALAEHRIELAGEDDDDLEIQEHVGCGQGLLGERVVVVDPQTARPAAPDRVGEIWIQGPNVAAGYWGRNEENVRAFAARLADGDGPYLRTGDLGFIHDDQLYVTGRVKDLIIVRGRNHYPQDIELTVQNVDPALVPGGGAAFALDPDGEERLAIIQEVDRHFHGKDYSDLIRRICRAVAEEHEIEPHAVVLIRQTSLPRTTSDKVQRSLCRERYLAGLLKVLAEWVKPQAASSPAHPRLKHRPQTEAEIRRLAEEIEQWLLQWLIENTGVPADTVDRERPFAEYGMDSMRAVELSQTLEGWLGIELTAVIAWNYPTPASLAPFLARTAAGLEAVEEVPVPEDKETGAAEAGAAELERLLSEIEQMDEKEVEQSLRRPPGDYVRDLADE